MDDTLRDNQDLSLDFSIGINAAFDIYTTAQIADHGYPFIILKDNAGLLQYIFKRDIRWSVKRTGQLFGLISGFGVNALSRTKQLPFADIIIQSLIQLLEFALSDEHGNIVQREYSSCIAENRQN